MNDPELTPKTPTSSDVLYEPGNQPRTAINRVRCAPEVPDTKSISI